MAPNGSKWLLEALKSSRGDRNLVKGFAYTERLWTFCCCCENHVLEEIFNFVLLILIILIDIKQSTIKFSDFHLFRVQRWLNQFVYITTNCSFCPLNCFSVQANCPICRSPNTMPSCSTPTSPSAATSGTSNLLLACQAASRLEPGQACQPPGLALHLFHLVVGHHSVQLVLGDQQHLLAPQKSPLFLFRYNILAAVESCAEAEKVHALTV